MICGYYDNEDGFFSNSTTYLTPDGDLMHFVRVGHPSPMTKMTDLRRGVGFGNTLQLADESLISCYSYRGTDDDTHVEVVKWRL